MFCTNCGTQLPDDAKFCSNCGKPTGGSGSSTQTGLEQERTNQPTTGTSVEVEPGSLQSAVREAQAGDVLRLKAGEHRLSHPLKIDKPLSLIGEGMTNTRVLCDGEAYVVMLKGDGPFVLYDLSFEHEGSLEAHVVVVVGGEIDIRRCRFTGGVWDEEAGKRGGSGLYLRNWTRGLVANCESVQNGLHGIDVRDQAQPTLEANACLENKEYGIAYTTDAAGTARQNTCRANKVGILVLDQAQPNLEANTCEENNRIGIAYFRSSAGTAHQNTCSANEYYGIYIEEQAQPTLEANSCQENKQSGIAYFSSAAGTARQNTCSTNESNGISVNGQANPTLEANNCQGNKGDGIVYHDDAAGIARQNTCSANSSEGIRVYNQAHPTLEVNTCTSNKGDGIHVADQAQPTLVANTCQENESADLFVEPTAHPILRDNRTGPLPAQTGAQSERTPAGGTEIALIKAEKEYAGFGAGLLTSLLPGRPDPFNVTLTAIVSGPPGSVEVMNASFRTLSRMPLEFMESDDIGAGEQILQQMTAELENRGFRLVDYGPSWFQRRFEREYVPGDIDYS